MRESYNEIYNLSQKCIKIIGSLDVGADLDILKLNDSQMNDWTEAKQRALVQLKVFDWYNSLETVKVTSSLTLLDIEMRLRMQELV